MTRIPTLFWFLALCLGLLSCTTSNDSGGGTTPTSQTWQKMFGGSGFERPYAIGQMADADFVVAGLTKSSSVEGLTSNGSNDYFVIKLGATGNVIWKKLLGGTGSDWATAVEPTSDGGVLIAGFSDSSNIPNTTKHDGADYYVIKLNTTGDVQWQKMVGTDNDDYAFAVHQTRDGGYIVAGHSGTTDVESSTCDDVTSVYVVKLDTAGNLQWEKSYDGNRFERIYGLEETSDGSLLLTGGSCSTNLAETTPHGDEDIYVIKLNASGDLQWQKLYGGPATDFARVIRELPNGAIIVAGEAGAVDGAENHGDTDAYVLELDSAGTVVWQKMYGGSQSDGAKDIQPTSDNGFIVAGYALSSDITGLTNHGGNDYYILKLTSDGDLSWQKLLGGSGCDFGRSIQQLSDDGFVIAGQSASSDVSGTTNHGSVDYYILRLNSSGSL